jgi:hypothetical protein
MTTATKTATAKFVVAKETKGTFKFEEVPAPGEPEMCGSLYVKKHVLHRLGNPETITVTVEGN